MIYDRRTKFQLLNELRNRDAAIAELRHTVEEMDKLALSKEEEFGKLLEETVQLKLKIADLEHRLKVSDNRVTLALETAEQASSATCSIGRITYSLGMCLDAMETRLDLENREKNKVHRFQR